MLNNKVRSNNTTNLFSHFGFTDALYNFDEEKLRAIAGLGEKDKIKIINKNLKQAVLKIYNEDKKTVDIHILNTGTVPTDYRDVLDDLKFELLAAIPKGKLDDSLKIFKDDEGFVDILAEGKEGKYTLNKVKVIGHSLGCLVSYCDIHAKVFLSSLKKLKKEEKLDDNNLEDWLKAITKEKIKYFDSLLIENPGHEILKEDLAKNIKEILKKSFQINL